MTKLSAASLSRLLWALALVTLPVTSFRFVPFMGSGTYVRPLAIYPLALLLPLLLWRIKRGEIRNPWPGSLTILLAFLLAALAATAFGATLVPIELRNVGFLDRAVRAAVTVVIGVAFFLASVWMNQDEAGLRFSVRWLLAGLVAHLAWGALQFIGLNTGHRKLLNEVQKIFSVRGLVKNKRISGFAYEPSWLAGQMVALYLPWLVAAVLARYRAFKNPPENKSWIPAWFGSLFEPLLLLATLAGLLMTYSRSGLIIAVLAGGFTFLLAGRQSLAAFWAWLRAGFTGRSRPGISKLKAAGGRLLLIAVALAALAGAGVFLADKGYIAAFFKSEKTDPLAYARDVYLGPRLAYAAAAMSAFESHPLSGVGLGASGFAIYWHMPDWALTGDPEIASQMSPNSSLYPNPKNLFVRLLAETGLIGFILFMSFYLALFAETLSLLAAGRQPGPDLASDQAGRWLATAAVFALTAVVLQGFSQDSFAMPEIWITLGMLAGAAAALRPGSNPEVKDLQ